MNTTNQFNYIYKITNLINNKAYVGQHNGKDNWYFGGGLILKKAIKKYGKENFKKEILKQGNFNQNLLDELEIHYIRLYSPNKTTNSYNITKGGRGKTSIKTLKKINQYSLNGNFIKKWNSIKEAACYYNTDPKNIFSVLRKKTLTAKNFIWRYEKDNIIMNRSSLRTNKIISKDKNGIEKKYDSITQASKFHNCDPSAISRCCRKKCLTSMKLEWRYENGK